MLQESMPVHLAEQSASASALSVSAALVLNNRKGGTASLLSCTCVKRNANAVFGARFRGLCLYFLYQKGNLIRIKTGFDTYLP